MTPRAEKRFRQELRGVSKASQRGKIAKSPPPYEDPREFGRRVAIELFEESVRESDDRGSIGGETD